MDTALPTLTHGCVIGRVLQSTGDSADVGVLPDVAAHAGYVDFKPAQDYVKLTADTVLTYTTITAELDIHGHLHPTRAAADTTGTDAEDAVWLPVGVWGVTYRITGATLPTHNISVTAEHTALAPLSLFANMGEPTVPLVPEALTMSDAEILAALVGA